MNLGFHTAGRVLYAAAILGLGACSTDHVESYASPCDEVFTFAADYVGRNYAGFQDKVPDANRQSYAQHKAGLHTQAHAVQTEGECHELLLDYISFFGDPHLSVSYEPAAPDAAMGDDDAIRARFVDWPARQVSESEARRILDQTGDELSPIEGIWEIVNADYRLAILPDEATGGRYEAVILTADNVWWVPGQIKATFQRTDAGRYQVDFYTRDHTLREGTAYLRQGVLVIPGLSPWARMYPNNISGFDPARAETNDELTVRRLDEDTLLLGLPDFRGDFQAQIDSLIEANWEQLTSVRNLIIDIRGNPGGSDASFRSVLPLLYTGPIVTPGLSHYATDDNIRAIEAFVESVELTEDLERQILRITDAMREHLGRFVPTADETLTLDTVLPYPERVAVIADRWCASSCESLVWAALQSDKATVFGENTGGFLDYGDAVPVGTPSPAIRLHVPTARSNRIEQDATLDNVGIAPDIRVPEEVLYWVRWVHERMALESQGVAE